MKIENGKVVTDDKSSDIIAKASESANSTLAAMVERNKEFNDNLTAEKAITTSNKKQPLSTNDKLILIKSILKNGMDSQQQEKALIEIKDILEN